MLQNTPHFVLALLGAWKAGAHGRAGQPHVQVGARSAHVLADAEVTALDLRRPRLGDVPARHGRRRPPVRIVADRLRARPADPRRHARPRLRARSRRADDADDLLTVARAGATAPPATASSTADDIALISYTSGTSGTPKGAMNTHGNITYNAERQRTGAGTARRRLPTSRSRRSSTSPAWSASSRPASPTPAPSRSPTASRPGVVLDAFLSTAPPTPSAPPPPSWRWPPTPTSPGTHFASFAMISSGGAPLPPALVEKFRAGLRPVPAQRLRPHRVHRALRLRAAGQEAPVDPVSGTLAVGVPGPDTVVRILDDARRRTVPFGEQGEIAVRGPQVVPGYWRRPEATADGLPGR